LSRKTTITAQFAIGLSRLQESKHARKDRKTAKYVCAFKLCRITLTDSRQARAFVRALTPEAHPKADQVLVSAISKKSSGQQFGNMTKCTFTASLNLQKSYTSE
jgi:hypothetical protein